jgi:hypothetical protein
MTTLNAFQDAVDDTQAYAGALGISGWLKLAALILLVSLAPSIASRVSRFAALAGISGDPLGSASTAVLLAVGAAGFLLIQYINAVADLVIVESLCTNRLRSGSTPATTSGVEPNCSASGSRCWWWRR